MEDRLVSGSLHDSVVHCIFTYVMNGHNGFCVTSQSCHLKNSESYSRMAAMRATMTTMTMMTSVTRMTAADD